MSPHLSKQAVKLPSQISPSAAASVTSDMTLADTYVLLCDWHVFPPLKAIMRPIALRGWRPLARQLTPAEVRASVDAKL